MTTIGREPLDHDNGTSHTRPTCQNIDSPTSYLSSFPEAGNLISISIKLPLDKLVPVQQIYGKMNPHMYAYIKEAVHGEQI